MNKERFNKLPVMLAMLVVATGQVGVSIYLPSLPLMSEALGIDFATAQWVVTGYLVSLGFSQLIYGPLADAIGRRPVFIAGQGIYLIGTLVCVAFDHSFTMIVLGRVLQGLGAGSASVISNSIIRDSYGGKNLAKALSYVAIMASIMPMVAPVLGGWLTWQFGWHSVFVFVLVYIAAIYLVGLLILPETLPYQRRWLDVRAVVKDYSSLIANPQVVTSAAYGWINFLMIMLALSILPYLLQQELGMSAADYGVIMILPSLGLMLGSLMQNVVSKYLHAYQILAGALCMSMVSGTWLALGEFNITNLIGAVGLLAMAQGFIFPVATSLLLGPHKKRAGTVTALSGAIQMFLTGFGGGWLATLVTDQHALGWFFIAMTSVMFGLLLLRIMYRARFAHFEAELSDTTQA
ncbi:multidrug effflux MFS transporter [Vibrio sp. SCSIO 43136]|uniref:multidrug effflux MFS transporter n=1 Tax=Vibrio sp. SCSIO 43136 TaxID=2819101 RepID=UPI0020750E26|nr:multidrug effflux MFS transporter [Vibrio sp. SCSIO 43136]USD67170.1 multidrug effflux MFS transporter [Vibrio sp. SCSIO 43136]